MIFLLYFDCKCCNNAKFSGRNGEKMYSESDYHQQLSFFGEDLPNQLDPNEPLLQLASIIPWKELEREVKPFYSNKGAPGKPILSGSTHIKNFRGLE